MNLQLPRGTASLRGKLDPAICGPGGCASLKLWSRDKRLLAVIVPNDEGTYAVENIPAGSFFLTDADTRNAAALIEVSLKTGEAKTLDLTTEVIKKKVQRLGYRIFQVFTSNGVPLPGCKFQLTGSGRLLSPHTKQYGTQSFVGDPGTYDLTVTYPGFRKLQRTVELILPGPDGRFPKHVEMTLQLQSNGQ